MSEINTCVSTREEYQKGNLQYQEKAREYLAQIDTLIREKSADAVTAFIQTFNDPDVLKFYVSTLPEFAYAHVIAAITLDEVQLRGTVSFYVQGSSLDDLIRLLKQIEFRLWEMEFACGDDAEQRLYTFLTEHCITPEAMNRIIFVGGIDKKKCYLVLSCLYLEHGEMEYACQLLHYGTGQFPEDEELGRMYQQLCKKTENR